MAALDGKITVSNAEYRPCIVDGKRALFHRWTERANIVPPSPMIGGHNGGVIKDTAGIVEYEDGTIAEVYAFNIRFVDNPFADIAFPPEEAKKEHPNDKTTKNKPTKEHRFDCPFCKEVNAAVIYADMTNSEYFAYCQKCGIETVETYKTEKAAIKAFEDGKNEKIRKPDNGQ